ncbi:MAG: hypothetical protein DDT19_02939 [Syntrophomonadaceae bacterium]|nr:hypothetical protein [Bacillota bacterium]
MRMFDNPAESPVEIAIKEQTGQDVTGAETKVEVQTSDTETDQQPEKAGQELILGKFKTMDDVLKAYQELEKRAGRLSNEVGQLRKNQPQVEQPQPVKEQKEPRVWDEANWKQFDQHMDEQYAKHGWKAVWEMVNDAVRQGIGPLNERFQSQAEATAKEQAFNAEIEYMLTAVDEEGQPLFPEAEGLADQMDRFLARHPYFHDLLVRQGEQRMQGKLDSPGALEILYDAVKAESAIQASKDAYKTGRQQGSQQILNKMGAALPRAGAKQQTKTVSPEEQVINEIFAHKKGSTFS